MPPMELVWRVAYVDARTGDEVGNYELLVDSFKVIRLQRNPEAAFNFAQAMKEGIDSFAEKAKYIFPEDTVFQPETIQMWFQRSIASASRIAPSSKRRRSTLKLSSSVWRKRVPRS